MNSQIFIPTMGRVNRQLTYNSFSKDYLKKRNVTLVCPESEYKEHKSLGRNVMLCPEVGISATRHWIMEYAKTVGLSYVIMCDDDHYWYTRKSPDAYNLRKVIEPEEVDNAFDRMFALLREGYKLSSIISRNNSHIMFPYEEVEVIRQNNVHGIDVKTYFDYNLRYDVIPLMEDFHIQLSLLELGYPNIMICDFAWNQYGSNSLGGCSIYRNAKMQTLACNKLKELHPDYVKIITRNVKSSWGDMKTRNDVRIIWRKAYLYGLTRR